MALKIPCSSLPRGICGSLPKKTPKKVLIAAACVTAFAWMQAPIALGQRGQVGGHVGVGPAGAGAHASGGQVRAPHVVPPRMSPPPTPHPTFSRPPVSFGPRTGFRPIFIRHHVSHRAPFFRFGLAYANWGLNCGAAWVWGYGCGDWYLPEYPVDTYVTPPPMIYEYPVYVYEGGRQLVELFLKDGTAYSVTDYWFVNDQVHFTALEEDGTKPAEGVIGLDELDVQKTIDVNSRRGFRVVRRDEPLEQYLRDHPDANAPLLEAPPKK